MATDRSREPKPLRRSSNSTANGCLPSGPDLSALRVDARQTRFRPQPGGRARDVRAAAQACKRRPARTKRSPSARRVIADRRFGLAPRPATAAGRPCSRNRTRKARRPESARQRPERDACGAGSGRNVNARGRARISARSRNVRLPTHRRERTHPPGNFRGRHGDGTTPRRWFLPDNRRPSTRQLFDE